MNLNLLNILCNSYFFYGQNEQKYYYNNKYTNLNKNLAFILFIILAFRKAIGSKCIAMSLWHRRVLINTQLHLRHWCSRDRSCENSNMHIGKVNGLLIESLKAMTFQMTHEDPTLSTLH